MASTLSKAHMAFAAPLPSAVNGPIHYPTRADAVTAAIQRVQISSQEGGKGLAHLTPSGCPVYQSADLRQPPHRPAETSLGQPLAGERTASFLTEEGQ